jgi:hypothetical protein
MRHPRLRAFVVALAGVAGLSACAEDYGYGYGGVSAGYATRGCDPYYYDCGYYGAGYGGYGAGYGGYGYYGDPYWGWWGDYYYPGIGFYVYDTLGRRYPWNEQTRRYWESRRGSWGQRNWNDRSLQRWDGYRNHPGTGTGTGTWSGRTGTGTWSGHTGTTGGTWHGGTAGGHHGGGGHRGH